MLVGQLIAILLAAWVLARLAGVARLPPLIGMILGGALVAALPWPDTSLQPVSSPVRLAVLALVLLRAGLGLSVADLRRAGPLALRLGMLPLIGDVVLVALAGHLLLGLSLLPALALGFLVGAISPAIAIPGLLDLLEDVPESGRRAPAALLAGAPLDNIVAVVALGVVLDLAVEGTSSWAALVMGLPWTIGAGLVAGSALGWVAAQVLGRVGRSAEWLLWGGGLGLVWLGQVAELSFVLGLLALGATVRALRPELARDLSARLAGHWTWARYALFALIGAAVDLPSLALVGGAATGVVVLGQLGRALGSWLATAGSELTTRERAACVLAYVPKATIQAAFASLALDSGLPEGEVLLGTGVLAVVLTAPLGVLTLYRGSRVLLLRPPQS